MSSSTFSTSFPVEGGCVCKQIRYKLLTPPLITVCCYCTWCQRETGSAFILNAMIEADRVILLTENKPVAIATPTYSGNGQDMFRCPKCYVAVWSDYGGTGALRWVKVGTLDHPEASPPQVQIFTENLQPWLSLLETDLDIPVFKQYYDKKSVWSKESLARLETLKAKFGGGVKDVASLDIPSALVSAGESAGGMEQLGHYVEEQCNEDLFNEDPVFSDINNTDARQHEAGVMSNSDFALGPSDALDAEGDDVAVETPVDDLEALVTSQYKGTLGQQRKRGRATGVMKRKKQATLERRKVAPVSRAARHRADLVARFGEDRVASDGELRGLTRQTAGGTIEWLEPNTGKWLPAAPHEYFRGEFIRKDEAKYAPYDISPEKGKMKLDITSNCDIGLQNSWTFDKDGFAKIVDGIGNPVGFINKPPEDTPRYPDSDYLYHNGLIMLDPDDRPVLDWHDIPLCFSSKLEGGRMEALRRVFPWLRLPDFRARMPRCASNEQGQAILLGGISTLGQRMARFRESIGCGPWIERNGPAAKKRKLAKKIDLVEIEEETNVHDRKHSSGPAAPPNSSTAIWHPITQNPLQAPTQTTQLFPTRSTCQTYSNAPHNKSTNIYPPPTSYPTPTSHPYYANVPSHTNRTDFSYINPQTESEMQEVRNALRLTRADFSAYHRCAAPSLPQGTSYFEQYKFLQNTHTVMWTVPDAPAPQLLGVESWHDSFDNWVPPTLNQWQLKNLLSTCIFPSL